VSYSTTTYQLKKGDEVLMEVNASSVERAMDYIYYEMPETYSKEYVVTPKPLSVTPSLK
jgi:hypothetical protein